LIGAETAIKIIAAVHGECRLWVISGIFNRLPDDPLSVVGPEGDKLGRSLFVRKAPVSTVPASPGMSAINPMADMEADRDYRVGSV
jgi:hypothetical protein